METWMNRISEFKKKIHIIFNTFHLEILIRNSNINSHVLASIVFSWITIIKKNWLAFGNVDMRALQLYKFEVFLARFQEKIVFSKMLFPYSFTYATCILQPPKFVPPASSSTIIVFIYRACGRPVTSLTSWSAFYI